ncbi:MAG: alpha/beta hydrolase [Myxococcota bacterium]
MFTVKENLLAMLLVLPFASGCDPADVGADGGSTRSCRDDQPTLIEFTTETGTYTIAEVLNGTPPALPSGAVERPVFIDEQEIFAFERPGSEPAVVLMHGLPDNTYLYDRLYPELVGRRIIAFDFVGWGRSSRPLPGAYPYDFDQQQHEIAAVLDAFGVDDAVLVAHDTSGPPAIDYTRGHLDRVGRLVLLNTLYGHANGALRPPKGVEIHSDPRLEGAEAAMQRDPAAIEAYYRFQMDEFIVAAEAEEQFVDDLWSLWPQARPAFVALTNRLPLEVGTRSPQEAVALAELTLPVDIVFGVDDPYLNPAVAEHFADNIPGASLHLLENAGHFVQVDAPRDVAAVIMADR